MKRDEFIGLSVLGLILGLVIWGGSHLIGHPVPWWAALITGEVVVFLGDFVLVSD